ncbi:MAG: aldo/keto reductase [Planctomycetes bacterium]|nr:aldo/keto reductase [Planctomycetota bacterium]
MHPPLRTRPLGRTGIQISEIGLGLASLGEEYGRIDPSQALRVVPYAIERGISFLDTSPYYGRGRSEVMLGFALRDVPREKVVLCTKLGRYDRDKFDFRAERVRESVDVSCERLGVDVLDIVLCHDVEFVPLEIVAQEAIPALRELQRAGRVRAVGASGYPVKALLKLHEMAPLDVVLSYANLTLHNRMLETVLPRFLQDGVGVINAAPFDMRLLTEAGPLDWHPAPAPLREAVAKARALCRERGVSLAQLAFQFALRQPGPAALLVGTVHPAEIDQWLAWRDAPVDGGLLRELTVLCEPFVHAARPIGLPANNC